MRWLRGVIGGQALIDSGAWFVAIFLAGILRYDFSPSSLNIVGFSQVGLALSFLSFFFGKMSSLYRGRYRIASFDEFVVLGLVAVVSATPVALAVFLWGAAWGIPRSAVLIAIPLFFAISGGSRAYRRFRLHRTKQSTGRERVLVYGAGQMSEYLIPQLQSEVQSLYLPVGLLDDDVQKRNRWISGVKMMGGLRDLRSVARSSRAETLIVAIPRIDSSALREVYELATQAGLKVLVLPSFLEVLNSKESGVVLRKLTIEDLVGRRAVNIDTRQVSDYLKCKTVLVTGAGGSIGIELCRQIASFDPRVLVFLDRDETGLQSAQLAIENSGLLDTPNAVLADIRDDEAIRKVFNCWKPEVVFHAAALKHLPVLERHPAEAWKTNVIGTLNVLNAALETGVESFINISTDKAADPTSYLGKSKKISEELTVWAGQKNQGSFVSVRFGNVLGSRGSLVPTISHLIESGQPVTITHPDATRYFMTIPEACQLVLQAGVSRDKDAVYILDMGEPVKVFEIIKRMIEMSGKNIEIVQTGLRRGEKLHEVLFSTLETLTVTEHPLISKIFANPTDPEDLERYGREFFDSPEK